MTNSSESTRRGFLRKVGVTAATAAYLALDATNDCVKSAEIDGGERTDPDRQRPLKLGIASYTLREFSLDDALLMTNRVAVGAICLKSMHLPLESSAEEIAAAKAKVQQAGILLYGGGVIYMKRPEEVDQAFKYAKATGMTKIIGVPAPELLPLVNEMVQQYDIQVCIHNHGPGDDIYPTPDVAYGRIKSLDKRIGLCHDVGHTVRMGQDAAAVTQQCADRLLDVHIKDVTEPTDKGQSIACGRGVIDLPALLRTLVKIEYQGFVSFEYEEEPKDPLPGLAESVGYVRGVMDML